MASDDEEANIPEYESLEGKSGIIFLIDSRFSMFTKDYEDDEGNVHTRFNIALKCCRSMLLNRIIGKQKDLIGVVLFGTGVSDPGSSTKHVSLLLELNYPNAPAVKELDKFLEDVDSKGVQSKYGSSDEFLLADALWFCSSLFSRSRQKLTEKRILLFTDDSDPHGSFQDRAHMARKRAKDLNKVQNTLEIIPLGSEFEYSKFYKELVETVNGQSEEEFIPDQSTRLEELLHRVNRVEFKRRRYAKIKWNLGNDVSLAVSLYTLYREAHVMTMDTLSRTTNEPVKKVTQTYDQGTGELLLPSDIVEYLSIGGCDVAFEPEEREALKKVMEPGLTLLGFKPSSVVKEGHYSGQPSFIYPEEKLIKGSRKLMKALVERCIAKQKVAVCCMTPRHRALTKYFYLVPSEETYDSNGRQLTPCGFHALTIPFDDEIREQTFDCSSYTDPSTLELVKKVVSKLKMSYKPSDFKNPKLQKFWGYLEPLALEYEAPQAVEDTTIPDVEAQTSRLGNLVDEFNTSFELDPYPTVVTKRENKSRGFAGSPKRAKRDNEANLIENITEAIKTKKVEKFTVVQLKEFLLEHDVKVTNLKKKADLVKAVYDMEVSKK